MEEISLLMISRDDILGAMKTDEADSMFRMLAQLTREGYHLLATAPQPEKWSGEHGSPDDALLGPDSIRRRLSDAGGALDGVYYVRRSLFTQNRNREAALRDILERYSLPAEEVVLLSSSRKFVEAARALGFNTTLLGRNEPLIEKLTRLVGQLVTS